jgi:DNA-binding protein WhiA
LSFAKIVKEELAQLHLTKQEEMAELSALIQLNTELSIENHQRTLWFKSNNPTVARRFLSLLKALYPVDNTLMTKKQGNFNKGYQIQLGVQQELDAIISEHDILSDQSSSDMLTQSDETKQAYLRGAFLASGSVNDPKTAEYHLEIYSENSETILFIQRLMNEFELNAKITKRRNGYICYLKDATKIEDFLRYIGASTTVFEFEDLRIKRDFNNSINRVLNCEIANEKKTLDAAEEILKHIKVVEKYKYHLSDKLKKAISIRKQYPDVSLKELIEYYEQTYHEKITKSGLNHRFNKIKEISEEIRRGSK